MTKTSDNLENSLGYILGRTSRAMANRFNQNLEKFGYDVTCEQFAVLDSLFKKDGQTQKELAKCTCKDKTSITRLIDGMWKRKLVVRVHDKSDARKKLITLTDKGRMLRKKLVHQIEKTLLQAKRGVSEADLKICKEVLLKVGENLS
jgi:DNA-binding MarR family transcriptional regulator